MLMRSRITTGLTLVTAILALNLFLPSLGLAQTPTKLLISQVEIRGSGTTAPNEYIVIKNPGSVAVDLSNYYLTDATFAGGNQYYYNLPDPTKPIGGGTFTDFVARFPDGATIQPGEELSISVLGSAGFQAAYDGKLPNFELFEDGAAADGVPDMRPARAGSIKDPGATGTTPTLSNTSEVVILFYWDGASDLVTDIDYVLWGTATSAGVDKSGISIDGPDADSTPTAYLADTPLASQATLAGTGTFIRTNDAEGTQTMTGGNGVGGRNETSENLASTFSTNTTGVPPGQTSTDTTAPTLVSASGSASSTSVTVVFSEQLGVGAATAANYSVYPTATPGSTITVSAASAASGSGVNVTLTLASPLGASTAYTVKVSNVQDVAGNPIVANSTVAFTTGSVSTGLSVVAAFQFGSDYVGVAFSEKVNAAQATTAANYSFSPSLAISSVTMQENGQTAIIKTSAALPKSTAYTLTVSGVTSLTGGALSGGTANFSTVSETVTNIATIQNNTATYSGQSLTMLGQVYITASSNGTTTSAFIQDGSGRGLNVYGGSIVSALDNRGNVVKVTGTVTLYFTTTEVTPFTATLLASGVPKLAPKVLTVSEMKSAAWEGTYIQTTATLSAAPSASGSSNYNYPAGDITIRVRNATGINAASFSAGDVVTAAGFGSAYGSGSSLAYQIGVGHSDDFSAGSGPGDTTPPTLASAAGASGATSVSVMFSEALGTGATTAANYSVYPTATPASTIAVSSASLSGSTVTLTLASPLGASTAYTVKVSNVQDVAGNPIVANSTVAFTTGSVSTGLSVVAAFQFGSDYVGVAFSEKVNAAQATTAANYSFSPSLAISSVTMQENGQTAIIKTSAALPKSTAYTLTVSGVTSLTGGALSGGTANFSTVSETVTNIATIQANPSGFAAQTLTMIGQVFVTASSNGTTGSAFIQDGSGRGLNVFGGAVQSALDNRGNVTKVTGVVEIYFTTTEITGYTATLIASGLPKLAPKVLTVAQMKSAAWEGTYIQTTATLSAAPSASGSTNYNYPAGDITFRVRNAAGINASSYASGDVVTAAGFGSAYGSGSSLTYQIGVGHGDDFRKGTGTDTTAPTLASASGASGATSVSVTFSEALGAGATTASNYSVYPTATPASTIAVSSASISGSTVTLTLASPLAASTAYTVKVSNVQDAAGNTIAANSTVAFTSGGGGGTTIQVVAAFQFGSDYVGVAFSEKVNAAQATTAANYSFSPSLTISSVTMQENGQTAIIKTSAALPKSTAYTLTVSGVTSLTGGSLSGGTANFSTVSETVTNIATIQASTSTYAGQSLTMIGQVYVTASSNGTTTSAFIQDGSGRGLNVFGGSIKSALDDRGNVAKVTGTVEIYFTTTEITGYTATLIASGVPKLAPKVLTVAQMKSSAWEGTFIQTTATLSAAPSASGSSNYNYTAGDVIFRVRNAAGINAADYASGDMVTAAGFGSAYGSGSTTTYQIGVGHADNFSKGGDDDITPPTLSSASGASGSKTVAVMFSEALGTGANVAANYSVYPTASPAAPIAVNSASFSVNQVTLTLASGLVGGTSYTIQVSNVQDLAGNSIAAGSVVQFTAGAAVVEEGILDVAARTLLRGYVMPNGAEQAIEIKMNSEGSAKATCRVFDTQGRVVKVLYDGAGSKRTLKWNGRDETFEFVRAGLYICHLMTTSLDGTIRREQVPIVVSVRLD